MARTGALCTCGGCRHFRALKAKFKQHCRDNGAVCWLCHRDIDYDAPPEEDDAFNLDHKIPRVQRPDLTEDPGNFLPSHAYCNKSRGARDTLAIGTPSQAW